MWYQLEKILSANPPKRGVRWLDFVRVQSGFYEGLGGTVVAQTFWTVKLDNGIVVPKWRIKCHRTPIADKFRTKRMQRWKSELVKSGPPAGSRPT